jgi:NTP pyrophosphatase (non-canonical NTP hydrolase)
MNFQKLTNDVLIDVGLERVRQDSKWGLQRHEYGDWLKILGEEFGEVCQAMQKDKGWCKETDADDLYKELIHLAAVSVAIAEQVKEWHENVCEACDGTGETSYGPELGENHKCGRCKGAGN